MRDHLEEVAPGAIDLGERDEGAAEIVTTPVAEAEGGEVVLEVVVGVVRLPDLAVDTGDDEVVGRGLPAEGCKPAVVVPVRE